MTSLTNLKQSQHKANKQNPPLKGLATSSKYHKPGFTIIEVVLVLAIAGLIFLMVFIALPALQRNQRDTQRKQDMSRLKDAVERYKVNNRGQLPVFPSENNDIMELEFARSYLQVDKGEFQDPGGNNYMLRMNSDKPTYIGAGGPGAFDQKIYIFTEAKCNGWRLVNTEGVNRYAIQIKLEGGGVYCLDG